MQNSTLCHLKQEEHPSSIIPDPIHFHQYFMPVFKAIVFVQATATQIYTKIPRDFNFQNRVVIQKLTVYTDIIEILGQTQSEIQGILIF